MWYYQALATAIFGSISVIINKELLKGVSSTLLLWTTQLITIPIVVYFSFKTGIPNPNLNNLFFIGIFGSVFLYTARKVLEYRSIRMGNLSIVYPLVSLGPIFTLLVASFPPLSEKPSSLAILGVIITLAGSYVLNAGSVRVNILKPFKILFETKASQLMMFSVIVGSAVIVFDKLAVKNTFPQNTSFTLLAENIIIIMGLLPFLYYREKHFLRKITSNLKLFIILGITNGIRNVLAFAAIGGGNVGLVSAIMKIEILFILLLSYIFHKDRPKLETIIGSIIMIIGVALIKIFS